MLDGFTRQEFAAEGRSYPLHRGGEGPGIVVVHEVPGITPAVAGFAERLVSAGYHVALPELFGTFGKPLSNGYALGQIARACVSREFHVLASGGSSPIVDWLRALCRHVHEEQGGPGVGALGMCLTGNFALSLMVDSVVKAPVLSQPSLPFPLGEERKRGLHISDADLEIVKHRVEQEGERVLGLRFTHDPMCPRERFERLRKELGAGFEAIEIDSSPGNPYGLTRASHSVLTNDLVDEAGHPTRAALDRVLGFFAERLQTEMPA